MTKPKSLTSETLLADIKLLAQGDCTPAEVGRYIQMAYEVGVNAGRLAGAQSMLDSVNNALDKGKQHAT